ncbi:uncharacterized protein LOC120351826 [Nilaparvata lugens]|uniref:uncharacterized protein LOC120351826 n=1 Tax=Nilaparvata lugens TaxID=108931 RepID=UPI00193CE326|nr:uncharacterized protein LOC120351826 [Nilaparvata lugens]
MFASSASSALFLLVVCPVAILSMPAGNSPSLSLDDIPLPAVANRLTMIHLSGNNTICPFSVKETRTEGFPAIVMEYSCIKQQTTSSAEGSSSGKCKKDHECVQGLTTIMIQMPNNPIPSPRLFNAGCFCHKQNSETPFIIPPPTKFN